MVELTLIRTLFLRLEQAAIPYCHWKSNQALDRCLDGTNDLDLLVATEHRFAFIQLLLGLGFKQADRRSDTRFPGIFNFYGHDLDTGILVHAHVHYRLVVGCDLLKSFDLPLATAFLRSTEVRHGIRVPSPNLDYILFVIRMTLKRRLLVWVLGHPHPRIWWQAIGGSRPAPLAGSSLDEWEDLRARISREALPNLLAQVVPEVSWGLFQRCEQTLEGHSRWSWLRAGWSLGVALRRYRRLSIGASIVHATIRRINQVVPVLLRRLGLMRELRHPRALVAPGKIVAFVGGDGSGKTTNALAIRDWLSPALACDYLHLGKPGFGWLYWTHLCISKSIRLFMQVRWERNIPWLHAVSCALIARQRWRTVRKAIALADRGHVVVCDRYPLVSLKSAEAPETAVGGSRLVRSITRLERAYYSRIHDVGRPGCLIVLRVSPEVAIARKPEDDPDYIRPRLAEVQDKDWHAVALNVHVVDAGRPLSEVKQAIRSIVWNDLASWAPRVEVVGVAGAGKTSVTEAMCAGSQPLAAARIQVRLPKNIGMCLRHGLALWRVWPPRASVRWFKDLLAARVGVELAVRRCQRERRTYGYLFDQGPIYHLATLRLQDPNASHRSLHVQRAMRRRAEDLLDLVIWLEIDFNVASDRIDERARHHVIKGEERADAIRFLRAYDDEFRGILESDQAPRFPVVRINTGTLSPTELARDLNALLAGARTSATG